MSNPTGIAWGLNDQDVVFLALNDVALWLYRSKLKHYAEDLLEEFGGIA